ncbi:23360_t:CDS:1, partial [Gigaspora rosea]
SLLDENLLDVSSISYDQKIFLHIKSETAFEERATLLRIRAFKSLHISIMLRTLIE